MYGLIAPILFVSIPILLFAFLGVSIYRYASARRTDKAQPGAVLPQEMRNRRNTLILSATLAGLWVLIVGTLTLLLLNAIAYM